jgi:bifunctional DNase/RNase
MYLEMNIQEFTLDSIAQMPVVILKDKEDKHVLPIWISTLDAASLAAELINRDLSQENGCLDLLTKILSQMELVVDRIAFDDLCDGLFKVTIILSKECKKIKISARPVEALVMAIKYGMPLHIAEHVLIKSTKEQIGTDYVFDSSDERRFVNLLEGLDPEDLGVYPM